MKRNYSLELFIIFGKGGGDRKEGKKSLQSKTVKGCVSELIFLLR